jgi:integral membrane sensor domain MASE1
LPAFPRLASPPDYLYYGRGLGASGAVKSALVAGVETVTPGHAGSATFLRSTLHEHDNAPLKNWLVFEVIGVLIGAFLSGLVSNSTEFNS